MGRVGMGFIHIKTKKRIMETTQIQTKFVEWFNAEDMHKTSKGWLSDLLFARDEQLFLDRLVKSYTLQLIDSKYFKKSKKIITKLNDIQELTLKLIEMIKQHLKGLQIMVDGIDQIKEEKIYKEEHRKLIILTSDFSRKNKKMKKELFHLIKNIMKEGKYLSS